MSHPTDKPKTDLYGKEIGKQAARPSEEAYTEEQWDGAVPPGKHSSQYATKYGIARGMAGLSEVIGWLVVVGGIILGFSAAGGQGVAGVVAVGGTVLSGLFMIMAAQIARATVDNADHTGEMLSLMKSRK